MYPQKNRGEIMGYEWQVVPASLGATVIRYFPDKGTMQMQNITKTEVKHSKEQCTDKLRLVVISSAML